MVDKIKTKKIGAINGIKGMAILAIIFYHLLLNKVPGGFLGVDIFLVLSGYFSMTTLSHQSNQTLIGYMDYFKKQVSKLWIPLMAMCLLVVSYATLYHQQALFIIKKTLVPSLLFFNNIWQIIIGASYFDTGYNQSPFTHLWYVALNVQLYLVLIGVLYIFKKKRVSMLLGVISISVILMAAVFFVTNNVNRAYYGLDTRAFSFFIGALLSRVYPKKMIDNTVLSSRKIQFYAVSSISFIILMSCIFLIDDKNSSLYYGGFFIFDLIFIIFFVSGIHKSLLPYRLFSTSFLQKLGEKSYAYYLWYYPVHYFYTLSVPSIGDLVLLHALIQFVIIIIVSECSYQLFHRHYLVTGMMYCWQIINGKGKKEQLYMASVSLVIAISVSVFSLCGLFLITPPENANANKLKEAIIQNEKALQQSESILQTEETTQESSTDTVESTTILEDEKMYVQSVPITFVGDSVLLIGANTMKEMFMNAVIDGKVSRQFYEGVSVVDTIKQNNQLHGTVVVILGSNGIIKEYQVDELIQHIGTDKKIFFVNNSIPRSWQNENNAILTSVSEKHAKVFLIDWHQFVSGHPEWLYDDLVHPNDIGSEKLAELIASKVYEKRDIS